jgi:hypothetical protein
MMRRLLVSAGLAALGLSLIVPVASAHNEQYVHEFAWTAAPNPSTANDGAQVYSIDEVVAAKIFMNDGVKSWDVVMRPVNGGQPSTCHEDLALENNNYPQTVYINCPWDTTRAKNYFLPGATPERIASQQKPSRPEDMRVWQSQDLGPSVNGKYTIEITAYNAGREKGLITPAAPSEQHSLYQSGSNPPRWREVWVVNGVAAPSGVANSYDPGTSRINVTWAPNPEPDVTYIVQEKVGDGKWGGDHAVPGNATRYERVIEQPGTYQYRVAAMRPAPTKSAGDATKKSDFVAAQAVEVAQIAPPTTAGANGADGAPDGGDPGVFIPGDTSTTTGPGGTRGSGPARPGPSSSTRFSGPTAGYRPPGSAGRSTGTTTGEPGEAEGEGEDGGFSATLPYDQREGFAETEEGDEQAAPELAGGVVPKPRDTRQLLIFMAISLTLFVFAMQLTVLVRKSKPALAGADEHYQDDFDDWLGGF